MTRKILIGQFRDATLYNVKTKKTSKIKKFSISSNDIKSYFRETTENFSQFGTEWMKDMTNEQWVEILEGACIEMTEHLMDSILVNTMKEVIDGE